MTSSELCKKVSAAGEQTSWGHKIEKTGRQESNCGGPGWDLGFVSRERQNHSRSYHTIFAFEKSLLAVMQRKY